MYYNKDTVLRINPNVKMIRKLCRRKRKTAEHHDLRQSDESRPDRKK